MFVRPDLDASVFCFQDEVGYFESFKRVARSLVLSLRVARPSPPPRVVEIQVVKLGDMPIGVVRRTVQIEAAGTRFEQTTSFMVVPRTRKDLISTDRFDGLQLKGARISNAVKCLPPDNKPLPAEIKTCNQYLKAELEALGSVKSILALGTVAHDAVLLALGLKKSFAKFGHGQQHALPGGRVMVDSYHCSRYNTNTRRLTPEMFRAVLARAKELSGLQ
jgi:uracil-DNA glycosylase family 4